MSHSAIAILAIGERIKREKRSDEENKIKPTEKETKNQTTLEMRARRIQKEDPQSGSPLTIMNGSLFAIGPKFLQGRGNRQSSGVFCGVVRSDPNVAMLA